jgi:hypothetical protein
MVVRQGEDAVVDADLQIDTFAVRYVANPNTRSKSGKTPFKTFWRVRDQVLSATRAYGRTGPEDGHTPTPEFWLVEDQYNDDLYQIMEIYDPNALTRDWLADIVAVLKRNMGWAVALGLGDCSILIYSDRLLVPADKFTDCMTVDSVIDAARKRIKANQRVHARRRSRPG